MLAFPAASVAAEMLPSLAGNDSATALLVVLLLRASCRLLLLRAALACPALVALLLLRLPLRGLSVALVPNALRSMDSRSCFRRSRSASLSRRRSGPKAPWSCVQQMCSKFMEVRVTSAKHGHGMLVSVHPGRNGQTARRGVRLQQQ